MLVGAVGTDVHRPNQHPFLQKAARTPEFQMLSEMPLLNHQVPTHEKKH
jgi:protein-tyrosine phosphatase